MAYDTGAARNRTHQISTGIVSRLPEPGLRQSAGHAWWRHDQKNRRKTDTPTNLEYRQFGQAGIFPPIFSSVALYDTPRASHTVRVVYLLLHSRDSSHAPFQIEFGDRCPDCVLRYGLGAVYEYIHVDGQHQRHLGIGSELG